MAILPPPGNIWRPIEGVAPGTYRDFLLRVINGVRNSQSAFATSWYRNPRENRDVGGHPESQHLVGLAIDLVADRFAPGTGLTVLDEGDHFHVQYLPHGVAGPLVRALTA